VAGGAEVVVAFLDGEHGTQNFIARLAPFGDEWPICYLLSTQPFKLQHELNAGETAARNQQQRCQQVLREIRTRTAHLHVLAMGSTKAWVRLMVSDVRE